jgi:thymidine phosphorylase
VTAIDVTALGHSVVALGGGRVRAGERIDPRVGLSMLAKLGEQAGPGRPLALVHAADDAAAEVAVAAVGAAYRLGQGGLPGPLVRDRIGP